MTVPQQVTSFTAPTGSYIAVYYTASWSGEEWPESPADMEIVMEYCPVVGFLNGWVTEGEGSLYKYEDTHHYSWASALVIVSGQVQLFSECAYPGLKTQAEWDSDQSYDNSDGLSATKALGVYPAPVNAPALESQAREKAFFQAKSAKQYWLRKESKATAKREV